MFGRRNSKYKIVENETIYEDADDFEPVRSISPSYSLARTTLFTSLLITIYYIPSIGLTFYQHWLFKTVHFPLFTVLLHLLVKFILSALVRCFLEHKQSKKRIVCGWRDYIVSFGPPGICSGIDVGFSNYGLELITITLYTMTKSTTIIFILIFCILLKLEKKSWSLFSIVTMISIGLMLLTYKSTQFNLLGFTLTLLASASSGVRWTFVQLLMQRQKMGIQNPIDMMYHMQPWMILSVLPFAVTIEGNLVIVNCQLFLSEDYITFLHVIFKIMVGAFVAFFMEIGEMLLVTYTSSLTLSLAGIFKDVFIVGLAIVWNGDQLSTINLIGLIVCLSGITSHVVHKLRAYSKKPKERHYIDESAHFESGALMESKFGNIDLSSESDDEKSDSQIIFDILKSRDR